MEVYLCTTHFHLLPQEGILICVSLLTQQGFPFWNCDIVVLRGQGKDQWFLTMITSKRKSIGKMTYLSKYRICSLCNKFYILASINSLAFEKSSILGENHPLQKCYWLWHVMVYTLYRVGCSLTKLCKKCQGPRKAGGSTGTSLQPSWKAEHLGGTRANPIPWDQVLLWSSRAMAQQGRAVGSWSTSLLQHHWDRGWWLWGPDGRGEEPMINAGQGQSGSLESPEPLRRSCTGQFNKHFHS